MVDAGWVVLQHVPHEGPALIAAAAAAAGVALEVRRLDRGENVPDPGELPALGGLVVMGGPMGAHQQREFPHLARERALLASALAVGTPVLGVCLGAQLLAAAAGAAVGPGSAGPEIGLGIVDLTAAGRRDPVLGAAGKALPVVHWHGDTFELPPGAVQLASSGRYAQQAFRIGRHGYGLQFHLEVDERTARAWEPHLPTGVALDRRHLALVQRTGRRILDRFFAHATGRPVECAKTG